KDLSNYESLMNGLLESGINRIDGISFSASNKEELKSQARIKAMLNAKKKAEEYAGVLNQTIGKAVSISEFSNTFPSPRYDNSMMKTSSESSNANQQTISLGEIEIRTVINVRFLLN
ncbi:MAG: SIMPL domain-containing protein, partial [Bacteroidetes bacterium]|nr:SIMPL domain-containing protein [Bacteroidota bacterium]